jgi:hypothetical protein
MLTVGKTFLFTSAMRRRAEESNAKMRRSNAWAFLERHQSMQKLHVGDFRASVFYVSIIQSVYIYTHTHTHKTFCFASLPFSLLFFSGGHLLKLVTCLQFRDQFH